MTVAAPQGLESGYFSSDTLIKNNYESYLHIKEVKVSTGVLIICSIVM